MFPAGLFNGRILFELVEIELCSLMWKKLISILIFLFYTEKNRLIFKQIENGSEPTSYMLHKK